MCLFRKKDLGKIYTTTDGYFADNKSIKKKRHVVVVDQRKDGAIAVSKLHAKKPGRKKTEHMHKVELKAKRHSALSKDSYIERQVIHGVKMSGKHKPIYARDFPKTKSRVSLFDFIRIRLGAGGSTKRSKSFYKNTRRRWHNNFKK